MTISEIRKTIAKATASKWFNSVEIKIEYPNIEFSQNLKGFSSIYKFITEQNDGWDKIDPIPPVFQASKTHFLNLKNLLIDFINSNIDETEANLPRLWANPKAQLQIRANFFNYDSVYTAFLVDVHNRFPNSLQGAYNYVMQVNSNLNDRNTFIGSMLAYEFDRKGISEITDRRKKEKSSFSKMKIDFRNQLSESETELVEHLTNAYEEYGSYVKNIDNFKTEKEKLFNEWYEGTDEKLGAKKKIKDLENTYEELLRLKKPADYWKTRAEKLKKQGWVTVRWLMLFVVFAVVFLYFLLWLTPEGMENSFDIKNGNAASAIKWSVIYVTFISFLAYGIRVLYKIAFSSFHLSRDAEEREQLMYVYLSLLNDSAVGENEKNLIMQSLFSRADTGLLKGDSSPAMPNDVIGKVFGQS